MRKFKRLKTLLVKNKIIFGIITLAALLRFVGLLPNISHADEGFVQVYSWDLVRNIITDGDFDPHTFKYGSLMFYLQALGYFPVLVIGYLFESANILFSSNFTSQPLDFSLFHEEAVRKYGSLLVFVGRAETAIFGIASVFVVYLIAKKLFSEKVGLFAAFFLAIAPHHVRDSHYITTDVLSVFMVLLSLLFLIYMYQTKELKWFILSGVALGISATIRYYPIAFLVYPLAVLFSFSKEKIWFLKVFASVIAILVGVFLGLPYLFLDPQGPALFMQDLQKYALPWYATSISNYAFSLASFFASGGQTHIPQLSSLSPQFFRPFHASFVFFNGFGILPSLAGLIGLFLVLKESIKKFLLFIIIPLATFVYSSSYVPASYERLIIPVIPFLAIFAGVFVDFLVSRWRRVGMWAVALIAIQPFFISSLAATSCNQKLIQTQSADWVDKNINEDAKIGYVTMVSVPPKNFTEWFALEPDKDLSLEEASKKSLDHAFINAGRLDYVTYPYFNEFFVTPSSLYENSYYSLAFAEYQSRAKLLGEIEKPMMCDTSRIYYYKIPEPIPEQKTIIKSFNFNNKEELNFWDIQNFKENKGEAKINFRDGLLEYTQEQVNYTPPRIKSDKIQVKSGALYTFSAWVKTGIKVNEPPRVVLRMDFYSLKLKSLSTSFEKLQEKLKLGLLLLQYGPTPAYFEKKRSIASVYDNQDLPGKVVTLSPRTPLNDKWQKISVTVQAPQDAAFVILSTQNTLTSSSVIYIDDIEFKGVTNEEK